MHRHRNRASDSHDKLWNTSQRNECQGGDDSFRTSKWMRAWVSEWVLLWLWFLWRALTIQIRRNTLSLYTIENICQLLKSKCWSLSTKERQDSSQRSVVLMVIPLLLFLYVYDNIPLLTPSFQCRCRFTFCIGDNQRCAKQWSWLHLQTLLESILTFWHVCSGE